MVRVSGTWRTTAPPEAVWEVVSDVADWKRWWPALRDVRHGAADGLPDRAELVFDTAIGELGVPVRLREETAPARLHVASDGGGFAGAGELRVEPIDGGSAVTYDIDVRARKLWLKPVEAILGAAGRTAGRERLREAGDRLAELAGGEPLHHEP